ncbi:MAG: response regulator [bacterium]
MIVDDEEVIRDGLVHVVDWEALGFSVVDTFPNGSAALAYLRKDAVDVVVADIRMPRLSGLDLARVLMTEQPETLVVILSGYDNFRYAQEAIDLNVFSYLLKPVKESEIHDVFARVREQLDGRNGCESVTRRLEAVREREAEDWLIGPSHGRVPSVVSAVFAGPRAAAPYSAMVIEPHIDLKEGDSAADLLGLCAGVRRVIRDTVSVPVILPLIMRRPARLAVLLAESEPDVAREVFDAARKEVASYPEMRLSAAAGSAVDHLDELPRSFAESVAVLAHRLYLGTDRLLAPEDVETVVDQGEPTFTVQQVEHLTDALVAGDQDRLRETLDEVVETLRTRAVADAGLFGGVGSVFPGTVLGTLMIQMIQAGLVFANVDIYVQPIILAAIIFFAVFLDSVRSRQIARLERRHIMKLE